MIDVGTFLPFTYHFLYNLAQICYYLAYKPPKMTKIQKAENFEDFNQPIIH